MYKLISQFRRKTLYSVERKFIFVNINFKNNLQEVLRF